MKLFEVYRAFLHPTNIGRSLRAFLRLTLDPSVYAKDLLPALEADPDLAAAVLQWDGLQSKIAEWIEEDRAPAMTAPPDSGTPAPHPHPTPTGTGSAAVIVDERKILLRALNLLGKSAIRNLVVSRRILAVSDALPKKPGEKPRINPAQQIPYALSAEERAGDSPGVLPEVAFLAGFHFDLLRASLTRAKAPREAAQALEKDWPDFLKDARFAVRLASRLRDFEEGGLVFSGALLARLGSVVMRAVHPSELGPKSYREFSKEHLEGERADERRWLFERGRFPILEREWAMLLVREVGLFPEIEALVRYLEDPWFFHEGRDLVLSDLVHEGVLNRKAPHGRRRMVIDESDFQAIRKKSE